MPLTQLRSDSLRTFRRHASFGLRTAGAIAVAAVCAVFSADSVGRAAGTSGAVAVAVTAITGFVLAGFLVFRRKHAVALVIASSVAAVVLALFPFVGLLALTWIVAKEKRRTALSCSLLVGLATAVFLYLDYHRSIDNRALLLIDYQSGEPITLKSAIGYLVLGLALFAAAIGWGLLRKFRAERAAAKAARLTELEDGVRQQERARIAEQVHDTVGHHLAAVAMQASALEVTQHDEAVQQAARNVFIAFWSIAWSCLASAFVQLTLNVLPAVNTETISRVSDSLFTEICLFPEAR